MLRKFFIIIGSILLFFIGTFVMSAEDEISLPDGTVIQIEGTKRRYLIFRGAKMKILDYFTFRELGVKPKQVVHLSVADAKKIPNGEPLKISRPTIKGVIDMHEHFRVDGDLELYLNVAHELGIEKTVFVPTGMGPDNAGYKDHLAALFEEQKKYPDRIIAFCTVDEADQQAPEKFKECLDSGGKGLKMLVGHPNFYDVPIDSPIMKQLFDVALKRDVPVLVHISIINLPQAKEEFKRLLNAFPQVRVQFAHYCSTIYDGINLEQCAEFLDAYPNLFIDLSMGGGISRYFKYMSDPAGFQKIKDFIVKYQDRILYGTDVIVAPLPSPTARRKWLRGRIMCDFSLHRDKWYRCPAMNKDGQYALLSGFELPREILRKLYIENPKKFLKME